MDDPFRAITPEHARLSVVQPLTISEIQTKHPSSSEWTLARCARAVDAGIPADGRLWLEIVPAGSVVIDGVPCLVQNFQWRATWMWGERHYPMSATGYGDTESEAFDALLAALG